MKNTVKLILLVSLIASLLSLSAFAADYHVFDAGDLKNEVSFSKNMSMLNDSLLANNSAYISTGPLENNYTSTNDTGVHINFTELMSGIKIKDYPVLKIGYKAMTEVGDTQITVNVTVDQGEETAVRLYCANLDYEKTGEDAYVIFNLATTETGVKRNGWSTVTENSPLYQLRIKPYISLKTMHTGDYFDIEYIGFFKTEADANAHTFTLDRSLESIDFTEQVMRVAKNKTVKLGYTFAPYYADAQTVSFTSDNSSIATIDSTGKITGVAAGVTTVRATAGEYSTACKVYVLENEIAPIDIISRDIICDTDEIVVNSLGDSITRYSSNPYYAHNYHVWWSKWYYIANNNYGISGTTITPRATQDDPSFLERYDTMTNDADLITVKGGTNDWGVSIPLGSITTRSSSTFTGSLRLLVEGLIEKYPSKPIVLFTPIKRCGDGKTPDTTNGNGDKLIDFAEAVIEVGKIYGIPVIDLYTPEVLDFTDLGPYENYETLMPDHLHPSGSGHIIMGNYMMEKMLELGVVKDVTDEQTTLDIDFDTVEHYVYTAEELLSTVSTNQCSVEDELVDGYLRIYTDEETCDTNTYVTFNLEALGADFPVKEFKFALVSYKSEMESYAPWNMSVLIKRDDIYSRHWGMNYHPMRDGFKQYAILPIHSLITSGEKSGYTSYDDIDDDSILKQFRIKPWGGGEVIPTEGDYLDIEYIAFFDEAYLANAYLINEKKTDSDNLGDIDDDGEITAVDVVSLARAISDWTGYYVDADVADFNKDNAVDTLDLVILARHIAGWMGYETIPLE